MQWHPFLSGEEQRLRNYSLGGQTSRSIVAKKPDPALSQLAFTYLNAVGIANAPAATDAVMHWHAAMQALDRSARSASSQLIHSFLSPDWLFVLDNCSCYVNHPAGGFAVTHPRRLFSFPFPFLVFALAALLRLLRNAWFLDIIADSTLRCDLWLLSTWFSLIHRMTHVIGVYEVLTHVK